MGEMISFRSAIESLGPTHQQRAKRLGVSMHTYYDLLNGRLTRQIRRLYNHPTLLEALLEDARAGRTNGNHD
jgi:hypothetical protein